MEPTLEATESALAVEGSIDTLPLPADEALVEEELLVEEISIDGMCGVY